MLRLTQGGLTYIASEWWKHHRLDRQLWKVESLLDEPIQSVRLLQPVSHSEQPSVPSKPDLWRDQPKSHNPHSSARLKQALKLRVIAVALLKDNTIISAKDGYFRRDTMKPYSTPTLPLSTEGKARVQLTTLMGSR